MMAHPAPMPRLPLPWPLPALLAWLLAWGLWTAALNLALPAAAAFAFAACAGLACAWPVQGRWRRALVAAGFPLSALAGGAELH